MVREGGEKAGNGRPPGIRAMLKVKVNRRTQQLKVTGTEKSNVGPVGSVR